MQRCAPDAHSTRRVSFCCHPLCIRPAPPPPGAVWGPDSWCHMGALRYGVGQARGLSRCPAHAMRRLSFAGNWLLSSVKWYSTLCAAGALGLRVRLVWDSLQTPRLLCCGLICELASWPHGRILRQSHDTPRVFHTRLCVELYQGPQQRRRLIYLVLQEGAGRM